MAWTPITVFDGEHPREARRLVSTYRFGVGKLEPDVTIRIWEMVRPVIPGARFYFETSHYIHTPLQGDPYVTSGPFAETEEYALHRVLDRRCNRP